MSLEIFLFGQLRLLLDGQTFPWNAPPKTLPLLACLLLRRGEALQRSQLAALLWPEELEETARANLRRHLYQLTRALPPALPGSPWLLLAASSVQWNTCAPYWLDVAEFERLSAAAETLPDALRLYTGDLLETLYEDWVFFEREKLREAYFHGLSALVYQCRAARNFSLGEEYARLILARDPFREDTLRQLITLRYEMGDRAGALREYEQFAHRLKEEMSVAPMPETQAVYEVILRNARPQCPTAPAAGPPAPCADGCYALAALPFVGRAHEMQQLAIWWGRAAQGKGGLALLAGEAGIGKTRLSQELALLVERQGGRVLRGGNTPGELHPYLAFVEAFRSALPLLASLQGAAQHLSALAVLLPEITTRLKTRKAPPLPPEQEIVRLFDSIATLLARLAEPRPLLLILEDMHWAGRTTLDLLEFVARSVTSHPVLLLATYREEETPLTHPLRALRRRLQEERLLEFLALDRLSPVAVADLLGAPGVVACLPPEPPGAPLAGRLYSESEGNPLFIELLLRHWQETGQVSAAEKAGDIRAAVLRQVERVAPKTRAYAEVAAVVGAAFHSEVVREVGGWSEAQSLDALKALLDRRLVSDVSSPGVSDYIFSHHLIQATLYGEIPWAKRKRRHLRAAETLLTLFPERLRDLAPELAFHFDQGGDGKQATGYYLQAVRQYLAVFADSEARDAADRALALAAGSGVDEQMVVDLLLLRESLHNRLGNREAQKGDLEHLGQLAAHSAGSELKRLVLERQILYYRLMGDLAASRTVLGALGQLADESGCLGAQAAALYYEGLNCYTENRYSESTAFLTQAEERYAALGELAGQVNCCCFLVELSIQTREIAQVEYWAQRAQVLCGEENFSGQLMHTYWSLAASNLIQKDLLGALAFGEKLLGAAKKAHDSIWQAHAHRILGLACRRLFRMSESRRHLEQALAIYTRLQRPKGRALALESLATLTQTLGQWAKAHQYNQMALEIHERLNQPANNATHYINIAETYLAQELSAEAREPAERALTILRQIKNRFLEGCALHALGRSESEQGEIAQAVAHLQEACGIYAETEQQVEYASGLADLSLALLQSGDRVAARSAVQELLALFPQIEEQDEDTHLILWQAARVLHAVNAPGEAAETLEQAYRLVTQRLASLTDPAWQESYRSINANAQILRARERDAWPAD